MLQAAKQEALLAVDLYNRSRSARNLEAFVVHMGIAWLHLFHAIYKRRGVDYFYRNSRGQFIREPDGERRTWDLAECLSRWFPNENDPTRKNVAFFIPLRNKIEHRFASLLEPVLAGKVQAYLLNFERLVTAEFGQDEGLQESLRFPVFLSTLTDGAVTSLKSTYARLPRSVKTFIEDYDRQLPDDVREDPLYEFRVYMVQKLGKPSGADLAVEFVHREALSEEQTQQLDSAVVMIRDRNVEVANLNRLKPGDVTRRVQEFMPWFNQAHHTRAWQHFQVRPSSNTGRPELTDARYCVWDSAHGDYVYTDAWTKKLVRELCEGPEKYSEIMGSDPREGYYANPSA